MSTLSGSAVLTTPTDTEIVMVREFDAPPELVWKAWTTPELVSRWWPGKRGTMKSCEIDLQVGGQWRYVMEAGEGGFEVGFHGEYREIEPTERLVISFIIVLSAPKLVETTPGWNEYASTDVVSRRSASSRMKRRMSGTSASFTGRMRGRPAIRSPGTRPG